MSQILKILKTRGPVWEEELKQLLRIPSVSADSRRKNEVGQAAEFVADKLRRAGLRVEVVPTAGHPLVVGEWQHDGPAPTVLIYGHYDVQPPDPLDLWISPPFEPTVRDGNLYARGATDDKGQMFTHLAALEAWLETVGRLPLNVKVLIEGEEEIGSPGIEHYVAANKERLAADYVVISDTSQFGPGQPAITYGLKGLAYFEIFVDGPNRDLHSGTFGGSVQNPINALCELIAALKDGDGRVQLPGFYDDVAPIGAEEKKALAALPFDEAAYRKELGVAATFGEKSFTTLERKWCRPTCDVNGITGGFQGEGAKTVLPAKASAKLSFRLVPHQDPTKIVESFRRFVAEHTPAGVVVQIKEYGASPAFLTPLESPGLAAASRAIEVAFGRRPLCIRDGGSIPVASAFQKILGADILLLGWGLPDDNLHAPNEKFSLADFHRGIEASARLLAELANEPLP